MTLPKFIRRIIDIIIYGIITTLLSFLLSLLIAHFFSVKAYDVMTILGLLVIIIGALSSIGGNPSGIGIYGMGQRNAQEISQLNVQVTEMERKITGYFENAVGHTQLYFSSGRLNIILNGIFIILASVIFSAL